MYNGLMQMPNNIYRAVIYIRLSEADEGKSYESESESITNELRKRKRFYICWRIC